jgi:outer membrane usher protein
VPTGTPARAQTAPAIAATTAPRALNLTVPLLDGTVYLGDVPVTVLDGEAEVLAPSERVLDLLMPVLEPGALARLRDTLAGKSMVRPSEIGGQVRLRYAADKVALIADVALPARAHRALPISPAGGEPGGAFEAPARFSAYLNARGTLRIAGDAGAQGLMFLDGAARTGKVVLEGDATWQTGDGFDRFERRNTRLVLDAADHALRLSAGDLLTEARGYQSAPALAGISVIRSYGVLQPQRDIRPSGQGGFTLELPSIVEIYVNEQLVRRIELPPGNYDLRDFPFAQGASNVRLAIRDGSGRSENLRFDAFIDQSQLAKGIDEFGLFAGVHAPPGLAGPRYSDDLALTGYYRRGISDRLTLGANLQADGRGQLGGVQAILASPLGTWRADATVSRDAKVGGGVAASVTFHRSFGASQGAASVLSVSLEGATRAFRPIGPLGQVHPYAFQLDAQYVHGFSDTLSAGASVRLAKGWQRDERIESYRANLDWLVTPRARLMVEARYDGPRYWERSEIAVRIGLRYQLGQTSSAGVDYDSGWRAARLSYNRSAGEGVGSYSVAAEAEHTPAGTVLNADASYVTNRAEFGFSRFTNLEGTGRSVTSLRLGSSIAFADGAVTIGAPVSDSFAIVTPHRSLAGSEIRVDESGAGYAASTGVLGTALRGDLGSYFERTITVQSPDAPLTANLGRGTFRLRPSYRSGYRLQVGSDYSVSVVGRLLDGAGAPLRLVAGVAREERENGAVVDIFTNGEGRFGATGLRPGRWRLVFAGDKQVSYALDIAGDAGAVIALGTLAPDGTDR